MYFLTGKLTENNKEIAYGLYDTETKRSIIMSKKSIKELVLTGSNVMGFERFYNMGQNKVYTRKNKEFMWKGLPELNGKGEPENIQDKEKQVLIGINGYKEVRTFITVNSMGEVNIYNEGAIKKQLIKGNIIGAVLANDGRVLAYVNEEITDDWLSSLGYRRGEYAVWQKTKE